MKYLIGRKRPRGHWCTGEFDTQKQMLCDALNVNCMSQTKLFLILSWAKHGPRQRGYAEYGWCGWPRSLGQGFIGSSWVELKFHKFLSAIGTVTYIYLRM